MKLGGARVTLSKSGIGRSFGVKGARYSVHSSGRRTTSVGIPGTGLSHVSSKSGTSSRSGRTATSEGMTPAQQQRVLERHANKVRLATERRNKPLEKLKELYSAGKITQAQYNELAKRDEDISIDLMIFGRGTGIKLAERYILGKVTKNEFEQLKNEVLGLPEAEKDTLLENFETSVKSVNEYVEKVRVKRSDEECNNCGKQKGFFSPLRTVYDFKLCGSCKRQFSSLQSYSGFNGQYYTAASSKIEPDTKNNITLSINPQYILEYR